MAVWARVPAPEAEATVFRAHHELLRLHTRHCLQFIDLTDGVVEVVRHSGVRDGLVNVQTRHTTTAILVNENEPLLIEDMKERLERLASRKAPYRHDDYAVRTVNLLPGESKNGHSHCKALFLHASESLNIAHGAIQLGRWQRIFLLELDGSRDRTVSVMVMGLGS